MTEDPTNCPVCGDYFEFCDHDGYFAQKNVESLLSVPVSLIDERVLSEYIRRARQGDDVYAYTGAKRPEQPAFWNIWDGEATDIQTGYRGRRIELGVEHA